MTTGVRDLAALPVTDYLKLLASDLPSPGGGSAASLCGALGASLVQMTCGINLKRAKNPNKELSAANAGHAEKVRAALVRLVTLDAEAYEKLSAHWKQKTPQLQDALKEACRVPLDIAQFAVEGLSLALSEKASTSKWLISDLIEAAHLLHTAFRSAGLHVEINLQSIEDAAFVAKTREDWKRSSAECDRLHAEIVKTAD